MLACTHDCCFYSIPPPNQPTNSLTGFYGRIGEASSGSAMRRIAFQRFFFTFFFSYLEMGMVIVTKAVFVVQVEKRRGQRGRSGSLGKIETLIAMTDLRTWPAYANSIEVSCVAARSHSTVSETRRVVAARYQFSGGSSLLACESWFE